MFKKYLYKQIYQFSLLRIIFPCLIISLEVEPDQSFNNKLLLLLSKLSIKIVKQVVVTICCVQENISIFINQNRHLKVHDK